MDMNFIFAIWEGYDLDQIYGAGGLAGWKTVSLGFFCIEDTYDWGAL